MSKLPKIGQRVYAWSPTAKKEIGVTVTHVRGTSFWGDDNQLERHTGLKKWRPADEIEAKKSEKLKGDQLEIEVPIETEPSKNCDPPETYAESGSGCNLEFKQGAETHVSTWAKFFVKGLAKWQVKEADDKIQHGSYSEYVALDIPENTVFTVFEQSGDKRGTDTYNFSVCKTSRNITAIEASYNSGNSGARITGNFEIIVTGAGKVKAPRLMDWWLDFCGKDDSNDRTNEEKLAFADHCFSYINQRGIKELPKFEFQPAVKEIEVEVEIQPPQIFEGGVSEWPPKIYKAQIPINKIWPSQDDLDEETDEAQKLQPRSGLDNDVVERYKELFDQLPPIDVFAIEGRDGFCLAGGWHRRQAAIELGLEKIYANIHTGTFEEAILFANTDNLKCGFQLDKYEVKEACKNFLRIADSLPASTIEQLVADVNKRFNKQATELSAVVLGKMFGVSDRTVANWKKELEQEEKLKQFSKGQRVEVAGEIDVKWRRGFIDQIAKGNLRLFIAFDSKHRRPGQTAFSPDEVKICDAPITEFEPKKDFKPGDLIKHWQTGEHGIVASNNFENPKSCWGAWPPSSENPAVLFQDRLVVVRGHQFDLIDEVEPPTIESCVEILQKMLQEAEDWKKIDYQIIIDLINPTIKTLPAPTSTQQEVEQMAEAVGMNGNRAQVLPDVERNEYTGTENYSNGNGNGNGNGKRMPAKVLNTIKADIAELKPTEEEALEILQALLPSLPADFQEQFQMLLEEQDLEQFINV